MKKLILLLSFMACLCLDGHAKTIYLDLSQADYSRTFGTSSTVTWTTQEGVSYTMGLPRGTTQDQWYGIRLGDFSKADFLSSSNTLDGELVIVSSAQTESTNSLFQISVWGVYTGNDNKEHETQLKLGESTDALFPAKTKDDNGDQKCTIDLAAIKKQIVNNTEQTEQTEQDVAPRTFTKFRVYLMHHCTADNDNSSITIKKVYVHHKTHTGDVVYDPNNGRHYVNLNKSEAWSAWGCVSIKNDKDGNMIVHIEPKKKADDTYYTDDFDSPRVLGGLVLDIDGRDFSQVLRVQMNQQGGDVDHTFQTTNSEVIKDKENMTSHLLTYLDVAKSDGTDINDNGKFWYSQYDFRYTHYQHESKSVKLMEWTADWPYGKDGSDTHLPKDFTSQDITISQFLISYDIFRAEPWHEASLRNAPMYDYNATTEKTTIDDEHYDYTTGILVQPSTSVYGSTIGVDNRYADVSHVKEIRIYATDGMQFKGVFNFGLTTEKDVTVTTGTETSQTYNDKYKGQSDKNIYYLYTLTVPKGVTRLNVIATTKDSKAGTIDNITLYDPESPIDYFISGQMFAKNTSSNASSNASIDAAKENRLAMNIDATDLRNKDDNKIDLTSANKNCLIYVNNKTQLSNIDNVNVVVRSGSYPNYAYTADNIVLTDAVKSYMYATTQGKQVADYHYPFFAPYDITATNVTYQGYTGAYGTLCLPFAFSSDDITVDNGKKAPTLYTLTGKTSYDNNREMTIAEATSTTSLKANQPAIVVNTNDSNISYTVTKTDATIKQTKAADLNITDPLDNTKTDATITVESELNSSNLQGVYSMRHPEIGSYVLQQQKGDKEVMFHKVVDTKPMMTQFRAYFTLPKSSPAKASSTIGLRFLQGDQPTGIESIRQSATTATVVARYNAIGERITAPVKGLNIMRMSDGTTKKIIVK